LFGNFRRKPETDNIKVCGSSHHRRPSFFRYRLIQTQPERGPKILDLPERIWRNPRSVVSMEITILLLPETKTRSNLTGLRELGVQASILVHMTHLDVPDASHGETQWKPTNILRITELERLQYAPIIYRDQCSLNAGRCLQERPLQRSASRSRPVTKCHV